MAVAQAYLYQLMFQKLFPQGDYWDAQFADPQSDLSRICAVKSVELTRLKGRMTAILSESLVEKTEELVAEWERVFLNDTFPNMELTQRRQQLKSKQDIKLNRAELQKTADLYGLTIIGITFPYRAGFFGFSHFGRERMGSPAAFSFLRITTAHTNFNQTWWRELKAENAPKQFGRLRFGIDKTAFFPVSGIKRAVWKTLRRSGFGSARFGIGRFLPVPLDTIRALVRERLRPYRFGRLRFGRDRLAFYLNGFSQRLAAGDDFFSAYINYIITKNKLIARFENVLIQHIIQTRKSFSEFENAIKQKLLANQIPQFCYTEE